MRCVYDFVEMMGYSLSPSDRGLIPKGRPQKPFLKAIKSNFHLLVNAAQTPAGDVYQELGINLSDLNEDTVSRHHSGIYDRKFITFQLIQMVMENQQRALVWCLLYIFICFFYDKTLAQYLCFQKVNKTVIEPKDFEHFLNFLRPGSSRNLWYAHLRMIRC